MSDMNRREVLKALGLVPLLGTAGLAACGSPQTDAAARAAADSAAATGAAGKGFFTAPERETVRVLVDYIIPRDARSGSATDAKVPEFMDAFLSHPEADAGQGERIRGGLAWLNAESHRRFGQRFAGATDAQRRALLDDIAWPDKARPEMSHGVAFFNQFRDFTASGFYSSEIGYRDLGFQGNVALAQWTGCGDAANAKLGVTPAVMASRVKPRSRA